MKLFLPLLFFSLYFSSQLFSQNKIGQIAYAEWDMEVEKMVYYSSENWTYDDEGREKLFTYRDTRDGAYTTITNLDATSKYDNGKLIEKNSLHFGPNEWRNEFKEITYNSDGQQIEELSTVTNSESDEKYIFKYVFEKDDDENRRTRKWYRQNEAGNLFLESKIDTFFNDDNCLVEESIFGYDEDGSIRNGRKSKYEYADDCQILQEDFYQWSNLSGAMLHKDRRIYEYFDEGKLVVSTFSRFNSNSNQWEITERDETEINDEGARVRFFVEKFLNNSIHSTLLLYTYTSQNEVETCQYIAINSNINGIFYELTHKDSFAYEYDLDNQIILKKEYLQNNYNGPKTREVTIAYEYYCNGQLKSEFVKEGSPRSRKDYLYHGGVDCPLAEDETQLLLFPNPTSGGFTIQADLLANSEATIQVFTILGQEVFSEKVNQTSYQYQLDLSNFGKGNYIVVINNSEEILSEKVIVF